jgi:hypothetical protein
MHGGITIGRPDAIIVASFAGETKITAETAPIFHSTEIGPSAMPCAYSVTNTSLSCLQTHAPLGNELLVLK